MKKIIPFVIIIAVLAIAAFATNPNLEKHKAAVKIKVEEQLKKTTSKSVIGNVLGGLLGDVVVDNVINATVSVKNHSLYSETLVNTNGQDEVVGYGAFGNVFFNSKMDEKINNGVFGKK